MGLGGEERRDMVVPDLGGLDGGAGEEGLCVELADGGGVVDPGGLGVLGDYFELGVLVLEVEVDEGLGIGGNAVTTILQMGLWLACCWIMSMESLE